MVKWKVAPWLSSGEHAKLGFTLDEIRALLALAAEGGHQACVEVRDLAARHLADVRAKIADLNAMEGVLAGAVDRCDQGEPTHCPLIDTLSSAAPSRLN